ncbi:shikimate dehydrogenase [Polaromonas sp. OV174]|uniref:shikimate dehydrogenase n=1 Tax=Polaromonas sp. OV174 TaxID=1855300 RepID=UPI0008EBCD13|nr:shikimate dehydrogenase [Polaromonas sp. OV174]SFB67433.1 shikimate dehydrogenase [Polaromonas sp. OV174]
MTFTSHEQAAMDKYYVLGNPIAHSQSPLIHARFAELTGQALQYERWLTPLDGFAATLAQLQQNGARGCNVTVPFKFEAFQAAATQTDRAQLAQAANTLVLEGGRIHADNTDGLGLLNDIQNNAGVSLAGRDVLLIGAGGAAAGALASLLMAGPRRLVLVNRTRAKADALVARHKAHPSLQKALQKTELKAHDLQGLEGNFDVIINASASSLGGAGVPVESSVLKPGALAYDMMYGPAAQGFMDWARAHGATPRDGLGMLVEQAAEAFALWRKLRPPSAQVLEEMRARLA